MDSVPTGFRSGMTDCGERENYLETLKGSERELRKVSTLHSESVGSDDSESVGLDDQVRQSK